MREVVNALFCVLRGGITWRLMPDKFRPWHTLCRWFARLRDDGTWGKINYLLVMRDRERAGGGGWPARLWPGWTAKA
jgi:transposase